MKAATEDMQAIFAEAVRQRITDGDWQLVAVAPAAMLSWRLRAELDKTFGALHEPVLVLIERKPAPGDAA